MNRGLQFFTPTVDEWSSYNETILNGRAELQTTGDGSSSSGLYVLTNTMPAFVLNLIQPDLNWCVDSKLLSRHETKIHVGSSYFITDRCVLGPKVYCWNASVDRRAITYMDSFAKEVSNGLRWILQIYRTTNILQQHDLFDSDLAVARGMRNKLAFGNYTPVRLLTPLREGTDCEEVRMGTTGESPFFVQPFGRCSGTTAPIGGAGQFTRPHLGTAPITGFCSIVDQDDSTLKDPSEMNADEVRGFNENISRNKEDMLNRSYDIFRPSSGFSDTTTGIRSGVTRIPAARASETEVNTRQQVSEPFLQDGTYPPSGRATNIDGVPQPPHLSGYEEANIDVDMEEHHMQAFIGDSSGPF